MLAKTRNMQELGNMKESLCCPPFSPVLSGLCLECLSSTTYSSFSTCILKEHCWSISKLLTWKSFTHMLIHWCLIVKIILIILQCNQVRYMQALQNHAQNQMALKICQASKCKHIWSLMWLMQFRPRLLRSLPCSHNVMQSIQKSITLKQLINASIK